MEHLQLISKAGQKVAYLFMPKVGSNSLLRTFFDSEEERQTADNCITQRSFEEGKKGRILHTREVVHARYRHFRNSLMPEFRKNTSDTFDFANLRGLFYDHEKKIWMMGELSKKTGYQCSPISLDEINSWFIFTFVRNPFSRLVSAFQDKFVYDKKKNIFSPINKFPDEYQCSSFSHFVQMAAQKNDAQADEHVTAQTHLLGVQGTNIGIDIKFAGKIENIKAEFEPLRQKYNLLPLERRGNSSLSFNVLHHNWRDYYTPETATMIYLRYKADFEQLGYEDSYRELMDYLETRPASFARKQLKRKLLGRLGFPTYKKYLVR